MARLTGFAVCPSGLEAALAAELESFADFSEVKAGRGGVQFQGSAMGIAKANLWARIPTRLLVQAAQFNIRTAKDILTNSLNVAWEQWFTIAETLRIDFTVGREPRLPEPLARNYATLLIKDGICDRFRMKTNERPSIDTQYPDIRVWAYLDQNLLTLYLDTSGEPLFKRGWRRSKGEAPLRENLAAALIQLTEWDQVTPLLDPFCGSGTILIEAMQQACRLPPGFNPRSPRSFSAEKFHVNSPMGKVDWRALRKEAQEAIDRAADRALRSPPPAMMGSDIDGQLIRVAQENAQRALPDSIAKAIVWQQSAFAELNSDLISGLIPEVSAAVNSEANSKATVATRAHPFKGLLVTNPPYGKRLIQDGHDFERELGDALKKKFSGWQAWILTDNLKLDSAMRLKSARRVPVFNGDLDCRWMRFDMVAGSMRDKPATLPNSANVVNAPNTAAEN